MPGSYSCDLRKRVIDAVASGASRHETAELFGIAVSTSARRAVGHEQQKIT
jgi:transposase